jgi:ABC-type sugar transport system permease subunit
MTETTGMKIPVSLVAKLRQKSKEIYKVRWPYLFISPFYLLFLIFGVYPILFSLYLSFTEWKGLGPIKFVGWKNFELLLKDKLFWHSMANGVILFFMYVPIMTFLALVLAVILNSKRVRGFRFFRTLLFIPYIMNIVAAGFTFRLMLNQKYGLVNALRDIQHSTCTLAGKCLGQQSFSVLARDLGLAWLQHGDHAGGLTNHPQ